MNYFYSVCSLRVNFTMRQLLIQMAYSVPLHDMHVFDATLHLHLNATILVPDNIIILQTH